MPEVATNPLTTAGPGIEGSRGVKDVVDSFHRLYYESAEQTWQSTRWLGVEVQKCPLDLWIYQELLFDLRPQLIVETGTFQGGSAYYLASVCDLLGCGEIVTIDVTARPNRPDHPRITYVTASSTDPAVVDDLRETVRDLDSVLVILDSDHSATHVADELRLLSPLVTLGGYVVVEDTNVNGRPVLADFGPGPGEAVDEFLASTDEFVADASREKLFMTFNPSGYLRRVRRAQTAG